MLITSLDFQENSFDFQACYSFEILPFTLKDYLLMCSQINSRFMLKGVKYDMNIDHHILVGHKIEICSDPFDVNIYIAISDSFEELKVFADLHSLKLLCK